MGYRGDMHGWGGGWGGAGDNWSWWMAFPMMLISLAAIGLIVWAVVALVSRSSDRVAGASAAGGATSGAEDVLALRLANGEIDVADYEARLTALRAGSTPPPVLPAA